MITLWFAPRTRAVRVRWLLEELGLPYELRRVDFNVPNRVFAQDTPMGKLPVLQDGDLTMIESGAMIEYVLERYGDGRLAPQVGSPERGEFLQWMHYAEGTAFPPVGVIVWHRLYQGDADAIPTVIESARERARAGFALVERTLADREHLLASGFSAADCMMGFTLMAARLLGVLGDDFPNVARYLARLEARAALQRSVE
jgi:glutathione S-transferase